MSSAPWFDSVVSLKIAVRTRAADTDDAGCLGERNPFRNEMLHVRHLFVGDPTNTALESPALLGKFDAFALTFFDDAAFKLDECTDERQHEFGCAVDVLAALEAKPFLHEAERNTALRQILDLANKVAEASTKAVETLADDRVAVTHLFEELGEFRTLRVFGGGEVDEEAVALVSERFFLLGRILIARTYADVTEDMCHGCSVKVSVQRLVQHCTIRVDIHQQRCSI